MLKFTVGLMFLVDSLGTIFVGHSLYTFYVFNILKPTDSLNIPWSFAAEKFLVTFTCFIAQCFYAHTIYKATVNKITVWLIMFMALTSLALGIVTTQEIFDSALSVVSTRKFAIFSGLVQGFAATNDVFITLCLCYYLRSKRIQIPSTHVMLDTLMVYAVSRGVLTAVAQILFLTTNVCLPGGTYWLPFHQVVGKLYVNSVLATLNVRSTFALKSEVQLGTAQLGTLELSAPDESKQDDGRIRPIVFGHSATTGTTDTSGFITSSMEASDKEEKSFP